MKTKAKTALSTLAFSMPFVTSSLASFSSGTVFLWSSFCYLCTLLAALHILHKIQVQADFGFPNLITAHGECLNTPELVLLPLLIDLLFLLEFCHELFICACKPPIPLCLTSCTFMWNNLEPGWGDAWKPASSPEPVYSPGYPGDSS